jgi:hypothetical protein
MDRLEDEDLNEMVWRGILFFETKRVGGVDDGKDVKLSVEWADRQRIATVDFIMVSSILQTAVFRQ